MYSVMIVDDEPLMLKYLSNNISRIAPDWYITGLASDGLHAVDLLQKQNFDLVITDIKMPEMDGLELAKYIYEIHPQTKVVIISGFDDFDYARRAIRCGVSDYLLKPLSDENLSETLKKVADGISNEEAAIFSKDILSNAEKLSDSELKSAFLNAVIQNNSDNIKSLYAVMHVGTAEDYACVMILSVDSATLLAQGNDYQKILACKMRLNQLCTELFLTNSSITVRYCDYDDTVVLVCGETKNVVEQTVQSIYTQIDCLLSKKCDLNLTGAYGSVEDNLLCLRKSYEIATQAFILSFSESTFPVPPARFISQRNLLNRINTITSSIYSDYISDNSSRMRADLTNFFDIFTAQEFPVQKDVFVSIRFGIYVICNIAQKSRIKKGCLENAFQQLTTLFSISPVNISLESNTVEIFFKAVCALNKDDHFQNKKENNQLVDKAKEYIYSHYSEPISLTLVAEKLKISSSYLSDLFHKEIGESYSKFITRVRMEQALSLMRANPNEKIYALATQVGFVNAKHFNSVFKKFYHMTPTEYLQKK